MDTTRSLQILSRTCFQCYLKFHKQRETAGVGVRQISQAPANDSKSGGSRPCGVAAPSWPFSHSAQAEGNSAMEMRPRRAPARSPHTYRAPAVLRARPAQGHRTPARSQRAPAVLLGHPGSSPHKEKSFSIRVNSARRRANTIGRVFTNEVSLRLR